MIYKRDDCRHAQNSKVSLNDMKVDFAAISRDVASFSNMLMLMSSHLKQLAYFYVSLDVYV